jgi:hypothetical protein
MVEVQIDSVRVSLTTQQRIVVLKEAGAERYLPIWIGPYEAESITIALQEIEVARPQTHDLLKNILHALNARLLRVEVLTLREDVFYGNLVVEVNGHILNVDSRPSDALALAVRAHVPILVAREVLDSAGIIPEENLEGQGQASQPSQALAPTSSPGKKAPSEEGEDRLSVFEDFLSNLDIDDLPNSTDDQSDDPDEGKPKPRKQ